jgi:Transposase
MVRAAEAGSLGCLPRSYGRRGRSGDPEYGIKNLLVRNLEHLSPGQFAKVTGILQADAAGQEIAAAWIGKKQLRHVLNLRARVTGSAPCERTVRDRLSAFYDWCACNDDIPELLSLARTVSRWEDQIVCAVLIGVTNATSESLNRLAKLETRLAYGFRNPANQRRRVRIACTRGTRCRSRPATRNETRSVTGPKPDPDGHEQGCADVLLAEVGEPGVPGLVQGLASGRATPTTRSGHADYSPACPRSGNWTPAPLPGPRRVR